MKSSVHNLSHAVKFSCKMGHLLPVACFDVVPGDKIDHTVEALIRTQPLLAPLMHAVDIDIHAFFVPDRIVWENSEDFHSGGDDGMDTSVVPTMLYPASTGYTTHSLADYYGLPLGPMPAGSKHSALPIRGYNLIYNNWYRDSQLQTEIPISMADGNDTITPRNLLNACWKRDYFTTARPQPQLGPEVAIPLTGDAPVTRNGVIPTFRGVNQTPQLPLMYEDNNGFVSNQPLSSGSAVPVSFGDQTGLKADLSDVSAVDIRDLREASAVQRFLEFNNIFGGRYMEQIMARFGVKIQDFRLQWPEYLGGGATKIQFSEVLQTAEGDDPVGEMRGHGIAAIRSNRYKRKIPEHGWVHVFMIVRPKTQYMQGQHRSWNRETRFDYMLPEFQAIGDQAILNKEIYAAGASPNAVFGFTPMYEEYRTIPSRVAGDFRDVLDYWHMARDFSSAPALNSTFVTANPTTRIYPATTEDQLYVNMNHKIMARRQLKKQPDYRLL